MNGEVFRGARKPMLIAAGLGLAGLLLTALLGMPDPRRALFSYLVAFICWLGIPLGALVLLACFHASNARWVVVFRRILEGLAISVAVFVPLFLPVALGMRELFVWVHPPQSLGEHALALLEHKRPYLNVPFFLVRSALYFAVWLAVSHLLHRWSSRQDRDGDPSHTARQRRLGAGSLPFLAITLTFAAFDWVMSLHPLWQSTMFGVYVFAGAFVAAIATLVLGSLVAQRAGMLAINLSHQHSLGKLLFAFVAFWAYIGFSQYMLIWVANLPEETPWFLARTRGPWRGVAIVLAIGHFLVPFALLLSRQLKLRPRALAAIAVWILLFHYLDVYWLVLPAVSPSPTPALSDLSALVGVGGALVAFALFRLRGASLVPARDPFLTDSLRYSP